jgi:hypothetical protein
MTTVRYLALLGVSVIPKKPTVRTTLTVATHLGIVSKHRKSPPLEKPGSADLFSKSATFVLPRYEPQNYMTTMRSVATRYFFEVPLPGKGIRSWTTVSFGFCFASPSVMNCPVPASLQPK